MTPTVEKASSVFKRLRVEVGRQKEIAEEHGTYNLFSFVLQSY